MADKPMTVQDLIIYLGKFIPTLEVKILTQQGSEVEPVGMTEEHIIVTSETAQIDSEAPEEEWDTEDGKIELGDGKQFILLNPAIN